MYRGKTFKWKPCSLSCKLNLLNRIRFNRCPGWSLCKHSLAALWRNPLSTSATLSPVSPSSLDKLFSSQPELFRKETLLTGWTEATVFSLHTYSVDHVSQSQKSTVGLVLSPHTFRSCEINFNSDAGRGTPSRAQVGSCLALRNELSKETYKARDFIGKGPPWGERGGYGNTGELLCLIARSLGFYGEGVSFQFLLASHLTWGLSCGKNYSAKMDSSEDSRRLVGHADWHLLFLCDFPKSFWLVIAC